MPHEFLDQNREEILTLTEKKSVELAGVRPSSVQLRQGLPIFYQQLIEIVKSAPTQLAPVSPDEMARAASHDDEEAMANAGGRPDEAEIAKQAGLHGTELHRLGYTLSHVVHAYGAMCQSITELATQKKSKMFGTYQRSEPVEKNRTQGWGLGLTLVQGVAKAHHGSIRVESSEANGTSFILTLPIDCREPVQK